MAVLRDPDGAEEVFQEFAVRFLEGRFRGADPDRGRFRHYLKTALIRMAYDHRYRWKRRRAATLREDAAEVEPELPSFEKTWSLELLNRVWESLEEHERSTRQPYHSVLRYRTEHPDASSERMADDLSARLRPDRPWTPAGIRKVLQRSRERFSDLLLDEVGVSLQTDSLDEIEEELAALQILSHCRSAVRRRRG